MSKLKWKPGRVLTTMDAVELILAGKMVCERGKPQSPGWAQSWQLRMIDMMCRNGALCEAVPNDIECSEGKSK